MEPDILDEDIIILYIINSTPIYHHLTLYPFNSVPPAPLSHIYSLSNSISLSKLSLLHFSNPNLYVSCLQYLTPNTWNKFTNLVYAGLQSGILLRLKVTNMDFFRMWFLCKSEKWTYLKQPIEENCQNSTLFKIEKLRYRPHCYSDNQRIWHATL